MRNPFPPTLLLAAFSCLAAPYDPPADFYDGADFLEDQALRSALNSISDRANPATITFYSSTDEAMAVIDAVPDQPGHVYLLYSDQTMATTAFGSSGSSAWNREHSWPRSFGLPEGSPAFSDLHALFPCNAQVNSDRGNLPFDWAANGTEHRLASGSRYDSHSWEPRDADKGRVARAMFYMAVRYDGSDPYGPSNDLSLSENANTSTFTMGRLSTLLEWNRLFPPDQRERRRNHLIHTDPSSPAKFQANRNPFVDHPEFADAVFDPSPTYGRWRLRYFATRELKINSFSGKSADPDGDGVANLIEFARGTNPVLPDGPSRAPSASIEFSGADTVACISHWTVADGSHSGLQHKIQYTFDFSQAWQTLSSSSTVLAIEGNHRRLCRRITLPEGASRVFFRTLVTHNSHYGDN